MTPTYRRLLEASEGNKSALARGLGVPRSHIGWWEGLGYIPERYALAAGRYAEQLGLTEHDLDVAADVLLEAEGVREADEVRRVSEGAAEDRE